MFIQCQHCNATFKIDESKVPDQSAFVRCVKCSNPIPLNRQEQSAILKNVPQKRVECSNCNARYSVPTDKLGAEVTKVRCGKCGHIFQVPGSAPGDLIADDREESFAQEDSVDMKGIDQVDSLDAEIVTEDDIGLNDISIPEENEIEMDSLYDNIDEVDDIEADGIDPDDPFAGPIDVEDEADISGADISGADISGADISDDEPADDSSEEYLDSISLSAQVGDVDMVEGEEDIDLGAVSSEERYKLFLKPDDSLGDSVQGETGGEAQWPEIEDETDRLEIGQEISDFTGLDEMGDLPDLDESSARESLLQPTEGKKSRKTLWVLVILILLLAILAGAGWFYLQSDAGRKMFPQKTEKYDSRSKLKIQEPLKGRMVYNKSDRLNLFLLEGQVVNTYPPEVEITWIEIKGVLYDQKNSKISEAVTFAGINLTTAQLEDWGEDRIKSFIKYQSDKVKQEFNLGPGRTARFQIVFFDVPKTIHKLEARINRFSRAGK